MESRLIKKLLYISSVDVSKPNGPGINEVQFIMSAHKNNNIKCKFIIPEPQHLLPNDFPLNESVIIPELKRRSVLSWIMHIFKKYRAAIKVNKTFKPDIAVFRMAIFPFPELLLTFKLKNIFIKTAGSGNFPYFKNYPLLNIVLPLHKKIYLKVLEKSKGIDVVSLIHSEELKKNFPSISYKVQVYDNAVDTDIFNPRDKGLSRQALNINRYKYLIGYVGNLADERGGLELIKSWKYIDQRDEIGFLILSGDQKGKDVLTKLAQETGIEDKIFLRGPVHISEVPKYISALDIGVSFRDDDGCSELKVRQYLSCGVPVIVSAAVNSFVDNNNLGVTVNRNDLNLIGATISKLLSGENIKTSSEIRQYAINDLSYQAALSARLESWSNLLE